MMKRAVSAQPVLRVGGVSKEFRFYRHPWDRLLEWVSAGRVQRSQRFVALREISFEVSPGAALGIVGANGAGKSTLLKIIAGTLYPSAGRVELNGRVASLLELGTGFHPDFTGRQNLIFNARFLGLSDAEIDERLAAMIAFAELGEFMDRPLRTYSSGMQIRLAFAVVANVSPHILIIDEALSVGDAYFQQKCIQRIRQFRDEGVTLLFVSHDPGAVKTLCTEAVLLHHGQIVERGKPDDVLASYNTLIARAAGSRAILAAEAKRAGAPVEAEHAGSPEEHRPHRSGNFSAIVEHVSLCDARGQECRSFIAGEEAVITIRALCLDTIADPTVGMLIRDRLGNDVYGTNTHSQQVMTGQYDIGQTVQVSFRFGLNLGPGEYTLTVAVHTLDVHIFDCFDWIDRLLVFKVLPPLGSKFIGTAFLHPEITSTRLTDRRGLEEYDTILGQVFGSDCPQELSMAADNAANARWLLSGWYPPEGSGGEAFCWTHAHFSFLINLSEAHLFVEIGTDRPVSADAAAQVTVWFFDQPLGTLSLRQPGGWAVCSLPIPQACRVRRGLIRMVTDGWSPVETQESGDQRVLGVRLRRMWIGQPE